ncbi:MAG: hypothetical protein JKX97_00550 [Candidatus Lindowbacteria bacterium]|nr:hypothetical protein [Candidatus Lindowbacteria bacterium]
MEFTVFNTVINTDTLILMGIIFFLGLTLGWFCRKGRVFWIIIGLAIFIPILEIIMIVDVWFMTVPFVLGFLVHTAKPLYMRLSQ